jgi:hypothetical protein
MPERRAVVRVLAWVALALAACHGPGAVTVETVLPPEGPVAGGTLVVVRGTGFRDDAQVFFGEVEATEVAVYDRRTLAVRTPAGMAVGPVDVEVRVGERSGRLAGGFEYVDTMPCRPTETTPSFAATGVPVGSSINVVFDAPIVSSGEVRLSRLDDGAPIATTVTLIDNQALQITPVANLRFWDGYALFVEGGFTSDGRQCESLALAFTTHEPTAVATPARPAAADDVVVIGTTAITASSSYRGLQVYDVTDPAAPALVRDLPLAASPTRLAVEGDRLYAAAGTSGVLVYDVTDTRQPVLLGTVGTRGGASDLAPFSRTTVRWLAVADGSEGVRIFEVTDPVRPLERSSIHTGGTRGDSSARGVAVRGDELWIAGGQDGLFVYSIATPSAPSLLDRLPSAVGEVLSVAPSAGRFVYAGRGSIGVDVVDANDPADLVLAGTASGPNGDCPPNCRDSFARLHLGASRLLVPVGQLGVAEYGVSGGDGQLTLIRTLPTGGVGLGAVRAADVIYTASPDGLTTWPATGTTALGLPTGGGLASSLAIAGDLAYVAARSRGLETWRLTPTGPMLLDRDTTPANTARRDLSALGVTLRAGEIWVGDGRQGAVRFGRTNSEDPVFLGGGGDILDTTAGFVFDEARQLGFTCAGNIGFAVYDLGGGGAPVLRKLQLFGEVDSCVSLVLRGQRLYVSGLRLRTADVTNPDEPAWLSTFVFPGGDTILGLAAAGERLVASTSVADAEGIGGRRRTLSYFGLANPDAPALAERTADIGGAGHVLVAGGKAFVSSGSGVYVFDLGAAPAFLEGVVPTFGSVVETVLDGQTLRTAEQAGGVRAITLGAIRP